MCFKTEAIEYKMDPRVLLNENDIFQLKTTNTEFVQPRKE